MTGSKFVVFEGLDACGKTVQAELALQIFRGVLGKNNVRLTREPYYEGSAGRFIENALDGKINPTRLQLAAAFAINRLDHCESLINPWLNEQPGRLLFCTRYLLSSLAYQSTNESESYTIKAINAGVRKPDLTIWINTSPEECFRRIILRGEKQQRFDNLDRLIAAQQRYREELQDMSMSMGWRCAHINGDQEPEVVAANIGTLIRVMLHQNGGVA